MDRAEFDRRLDQLEVEMAKLAEERGRKHGATFPQETRNAMWKHLILEGGESPENVLGDLRMSLTLLIIEPTSAKDTSETRH